MYTWISLSTIADLAQLEACVPSEYEPKRVAKRLIEGISDAVKGVLIESDYIDKDYRSTYYNFYAKKGRVYRSDCVRLHFFDQSVSFDEIKLTLNAADGKLADHFYGYMVLRPTGIATIGRTVLSPGIRRGANKYIIASDHKVHLLGYKLFVRGFPSMDQHIDISVCAHAACWSILRHYSERYNVHREYLIHDITMMAHEFNPGGLVPSQGLHIGHAERVFQEAGTFPVHIARDQGSAADPSFCRQLYAYIESGFPVFAAIDGHAFAVVGYDWRQPVKLADKGIRYAWDEVQSVAVVDDNHLPYLSVPVSEASRGIDQGYSAESIYSFIVALPEKIFYPADAVDQVAPSLLKFADALEFSSSEDLILRYFITTGAALRSFVRDKASEFDPDLFVAHMELPFAQFVWIVEIATEDQWMRGQIEARAVIDATASVRENLPLWLFYSLKSALIFDRQNPSAMGSLELNATGHSGYSRMEVNLRPIAQLKGVSNG